VARASTDVELDSYAFHNSRHAWEQDRRREREAYARGDEFRRYSYDDVLATAAHDAGGVTAAARRGVGIGA